MRLRPDAARAPPRARRMLQVGKVLANDPPGRAAFVHSGGLAAVQRLGEAPGSGLREAVEVINSSYPEDVVRYYSPSYESGLLSKLEAMAAAAAPQPVV